MMADRKKVEPLLKTARGQIDGVLKMIEDNRYCMDIMMQLQAVESLVHKAQREVLRGHLPAACRMRLRPEIRTNASRRLQKSSSCWIKRKRKDVSKGTSFFYVKIWKIKGNISAELCYNLCVAEITCCADEPIRFHVPGTTGSFS